MDSLTAAPLSLVTPLPVLPAELADALATDVLLERAWTKLSDVQRACYVEWVETGPTPRERRTRTDLVGAVVLRLGRPLPSSAAAIRS